MNQIANQLALILILLGTCSGLFVAGVLLRWRKRHASVARRSPLTEDLLRGPGHGVREQIEKISDDMDTWATQIVLIPLVLYALHLSQSYLLGTPESTSRIIISVVVGVAVVGYGTWRLLRLAQQRERLALGLDAEIAVAQELSQLMREGAVVFHDFPAEGFNIDHIVVCSAGVYAIETKGRSKPKNGDGRKDARVEFDGKALKFPRWIETKPLAQAERQAHWLQKWLSSAIGEPISVMPVLVLPGWFVDGTGRGRVTVFNGKKPSFLLRVKNAEPLSPQAIQRAAHQIEQRCRTVKRTLGPLGA